ncbi:MAG: hypothetical protein HY314_14665, partial [Acidobacteria bacterium]|nr:hypothetical protein [Acidobacteriota bacterium]
ITIEEGRQFTLRFVEFVGNTITRDKVLRRELLVPEGEIFDQTLWKLSLQRLNQLGFFEEIKESDATFKPDERTGKLDIDLRVKEKGRNQIQFTGGASGIGGSFFGLEYSTNNLFGYGESLTFSVAAGNRQKSFLFSFSVTMIHHCPCHSSVMKLSAPSPLLHFGPCCFVTRAKVEGFAMSAADYEN